MAAGLATSCLFSDEHYSQLCGSADTRSAASPPASSLPKLLQPAAQQPKEAAARACCEANRAASSGLAQEISGQVLGDVPRHLQPHGCGAGCPQTEARGVRHVNMGYGYIRPMLKNLSTQWNRCTGQANGSIQLLHKIDGKTIRRCHSLCTGTACGNIFSCTASH